MDLRQLLKMLRVRWRLATSVLLLCVLGAAAVTSVIPPKYSSTVRVYFAGSGSAGAESPVTGWYAQQRVLSYAQLATDPSLLGRVIKATGADTTVTDLAQRVTPVVPLNTAILEITVVDRNPTLAQDLARAEAEEISSLVDVLEAPPTTPANKTPVSSISARPAGEPSYNPNRINPDVSLNLVIGLLIGIILGVAAAVLREFFDTSVRSSRELGELTGSPVMAVVPLDASFRRFPLISDTRGPAGRGEPYRVLRTNLQFIDLDSKHQMFVVTSAVADEGKSVVAANLAVAMAQAGRSVLLVDGDLRNPNAANLLGLSNDIGLMTVVTGQASLDKCVQEHSDGLHVLATGPQPPNPAEVLDTDAVRALLSRAHEEYDVVIIDSPPLLPVADPAILAGIVGGALLVVKHSKTGRDLVRQAVERLDAVGAKCYGVIPNMAPRDASNAGGSSYGELPQAAAARSIRRSKRDGVHSRPRA